MTQTPTDALRLVPVEPTEAMLDAVKPWPEHWPPYGQATVTARAAYDIDRAVLRSNWKHMLAAAPASPLPRGGWQDISTAPKDGTHFLWCRLDDMDGNAGMHVVFWGHGEFRYASDHEKFVGDPVDSWMPLPAAPTGDQK